ncbi:MAG: peptidase S41, partial [Alistipes sp.]|nr:peptidase S41 [Alistipes sp.]
VARKYVEEVFHTINSNLHFGEIKRNGRTFAYIYQADFEYEWQANDYKYIKPIVEKADGIIFDIRNNPGGSGDIGLKLAGMFFKEKTHVGYHALKGGPGHNDMTELTPIYSKPSKFADWSDKKTMLLTNREVYSTANLFSSALKLAKNVTQIGGITGGGGAMPMTHFLPNGWIVVFPANMLFDVNKQHIESGIAPDIEVTATDEELEAGRDAIIERAIEELMK